MKTLKYIPQTAVMFFALLPLNTPAYAAAFKDISASSNAVAIRYLGDHNVIAGYADGTFKPNNSINRAELSKILVTGTGNNPSVGQYHDCFSDVHTEWFAPYVCFAKAKGWVAGYPNGTFRAGNPVNTAEALKMILNAQGISASANVTSSSYTDVVASAWYAPYVAAAHEKNLLQRTGGNLGVANFMTRGLVAESIYRAMSMKTAGSSRFEVVVATPASSAPASSAPASSTPASSTPASSTPTSSVASSVPAVVEKKQKYNNGTYTANGVYRAPSGNETIEISLTIKNDIIVDSTYKGFAAHGRSQSYQTLFRNGYEEKVIGKPVDEVSLHIVNGASLTPIGFMDALSKIKTEAAA